MMVYHLQEVIRALAPLNISSMTRSLGVALGIFGITTLFLSRTFTLGCFIMQIPWLPWCIIAATAITTILLLPPLWKELPLAILLFRDERLTNVTQHCPSTTCMSENPKSNNEGWQDQEMGIPLLFFRYSQRWSLASGNEYGLHTNMAETLCFVSKRWGIQAKWYCRLPMKKNESFLGDACWFCVMIRQWFKACWFTIVTFPLDIQYSSNITGLML